MTATVDDDFRDFVVARWPELECVARVVVLDPEPARAATTGALARLQQRWSETVEDGRPGDEARRAVLRAAVDTATRRGRPTTAVPDAVPPSVTPAGPPDVPSGVRWGNDPAGEEDPVVAALVAAVRSAPPLERAVLAAATLWDAGPDEVARLLDVSAGTVHEHAASLRSRLETSHDTARVAAGLEPSPWARDQDITAAVDVLLRGLADPPDPAALVAGRRRGLRRRTLVAGGVAVVALGGAGAVLAGRGTRSRVTASGPGAPASLSPDDPRWASAAQWPARGPLAGDPGLASLVGGGAARGDHVLWAGDLGTRRVVLVWTRPGDVEGDGDGMGPGVGLSDTFVRMFEGPSGTDPPRLGEAVRPFLVMPGTTDVVAVMLPDGPSEEGDRSLLLVLARPTVVTASVSYLVRPLRDGTLARSWSPLVLERGVVASVLDRPLALAMRLRVAGWEGTPGSP
ncbi:MAG TPA: hypothetical protein VFI44_07945, partial [Ornithinibacter sp.]|nr:hypothetical protein [Ornithinibacter sp.]